jgi:nicotinamide phosphoribosyltransferase
MVAIENTDSEFYWLTNYLETLMSCTIWLPMTSATAAYEFRQMLNRFAKMTDPSGAGVPPQFQGHDFSMRGMGSLEDACKSGAGHLLSFVGTDTIPAISFLEHYYFANVDEELVGTSIPATEHSVMCAHGEDELETFRHLLTEVYPTGYVSVVSDTWNLWDVLTKTLPALKDTIMKRDGKLVIRPDSGDPVKIICGDPDGTSEVERKGVIQLLWDTFGGTTYDYRVLDKHIGCIYGDAITYERCATICNRLEMKGFASTNMVYGIGSFTYQYVTRDTFGFALKSTYSRIGGKEHLLFKDPVTDPNAVKKSQKGKVVVLRRDNGDIYYVDELYADQEAAYASKNLLQPVYYNGQLTLTTLKEIRGRLLE